jgi:hypothetical protein
LAGLELRQGINIEHSTSNIECHCAPHYEKSFAKISWQIRVKGVKTKRHTGSSKTNVKTENQKQSAASAAVLNETGNFTHRTTLEARPRRGVPKAFL